MRHPDLAPANPNIAMTATTAIQHYCPFVSEVDNGTITINWVTGDSTIELHSLANFLGHYADQKISHEDLVDEVFDSLEYLTPHIILCSVTARFTTAGIDVEVRRGPVHVDAVGT